MKRVIQQEFPHALAQALQGFRHPSLSCCQLVTTPKGGWAVIATLRAGKQGPVKELETLIGKTGVPVQYETHRRLAVARPAYPARGE